MQCLIRLFLRFDIVSALFDILFLIKFDEIDMTLTINK